MRNRVGLGRDGRHPRDARIVFGLLYLTFRSVVAGGIVILSLPFALAGGVWLMWLLQYIMSTAVAVRFKALAGVAAETGVITLVYLDHA